MGAPRQLHQPKGWFRAVTVQDAASLARDGKLFYDVNELNSTGEQLLEVRFADGVWLLADPQDLAWA